MERQRLGAWGRGNDAARSLRRAVEHHGAGADPGTADVGVGRIVVKRVGVGVVGCGNISAAYLTAARKFPILEIVALADANTAAAEARSVEFGFPAFSVEGLLANPAIEIVLNLTVPKAHVEVGLKAIAAGKHVHSEKPLGITVTEARKLIDAAAAKNLR